MSAPAKKLLTVAKVIRSFGTKGEINIRYSPGVNGDIDEKKPVFISFDGLPVPFFIESLVNKGHNQAIVKLEGVNNLNLADELCGKEIKAESSREGDFDEDNSQNEAEYYLGFVIINRSGVVLGRVVSFYDYPGNPCFGVERAEKKGEEFLLPIHEDIILKEDHDGKTLTVELPHGLLDINL